MTLVLTPAVLTLFLVGSDALSEGLRAECSQHALAIPHGADLDCAERLHALVRAGRLPDAEAQRALGLLDHMAIARFSPHPHLSRIWQLLPDLGPETASCAALAESIEAELLTLDPLPASGLSCSVRVLRSTSNAGA